MGVSSWLWNLILLPCPEATRCFSLALPFMLIFLRGRAAGVRPARKVGDRLGSCFAAPGTREPHSLPLRIAPSSANLGAAAATIWRQRRSRRSSPTAPRSSAQSPGIWTQCSGKRTGWWAPWTEGSPAPFPASRPGPGWGPNHTQAAPDWCHLPPVSAGRGFRLPDAAGAAEETAAGLGRAAAADRAQLGPGRGAPHASAVFIPGPRRVTNSPWLARGGCALRDEGG